MIPPMHVVTKKTGKPKGVINFQKLNQACLRQTLPTKAPLMQGQSVLLNSTMTVMDA